MSFWTYVLKCTDGSFYVGHTDDLEKRMAMHQDGTYGGYTSKRRPVVVAHVEMFDTREEAFLRERQIKGWSRAKKQALADQDWVSLQRLARSQSSASTPE